MSAGDAVAAPPDWFAAALGTACERMQVEVAGAAVETIAWGARGRPGLLFAHGMMAHARWWNFLAPLLADDYRCAALSFSGMGSSGWRERYSIRTYVDELEAVIAATGLDAGPGRPVVVAHSFGSFPARRLAEWRGDALGGLVLLDAPIRASNQYRPSPPRLHALKPYPSVAEAVASFRLVPEQVCHNRFLVEHVAAEGLRRREDGWVRCFDPDLRAKMSSSEYHAGLGVLGCPVAFVWGERSRLNTEEARAVARAAYPDAPCIEIPYAAHHVMLDQPHALVSALRGLLSAWSREPAPVSQ